MIDKSEVEKRLKDCNISVIIKELRINSSGSYFHQDLKQIESNLGTSKKMESVKKLVQAFSSYLTDWLEEGLLLGHRQSAGYKKGVYSTYPAAMETIRLIYEYTQNNRTKRSADLIFTLFWNGYAVNENKLKEAMVDYQRTLRWSFNKISRQHEDPDQLERILKRLLNEDQKLIPNKPGRPSKQDRAEKEKSSIIIERNIFCS